MSKFECVVTRCIGDQKLVTSSENLLPGDVIEIDNDFVLPCDLLLATGQVVVNESMLTGESVPVIKNAFPKDSEDIYSVDDDKTYTLYSGTRVIQSRKLNESTVRAIVVRTGFQTAKGNLVLSILYPKPTDLKFYSDSIKFIVVMFFVGMIGFIYSAIQLHMLGVGIGRIIIRALDIITITVPPALPIALTIGTSFAIRRLIERKIYCISPPRINVSGMVDLVCFDKTGTLTECDLDLYCVVPYENDFKSLVLGSQLPGLETVNSPSSLLLTGLVSCQGLCRVQNQLVGDPLELVILKATRWSFLEKNEKSALDCVRSTDKNRKVYIWRRFDFSSQLARMSVVASDDSKLHIFTKGSPEILREIFDEIPSNYDSVLGNFSRNGYRVLALGSKDISHLTKDQMLLMPRADLEVGLKFLGFIILENKLKQETREIITDLNHAGIQSVMITGDNPLTSINIARKCNLVPESSQVFISEIYKNQVIWRDVETGDTIKNIDDPLEYGLNTKMVLVLNGVSMQHIYRENPDDIRKILMKCRIYARMSPDQKMKIIQEYMDLGNHVGMIGDGANDCNALKAAHMGVSLSESEASISAPFLSLNTNIDCVPIIIKDGRAALVSSMQVFKYMASFSMLSFFAVVLLYQINSNMGDFQFLYIDIFIILPIAFLMGMSAPSEGLGKQKPDQALFSPIVFVSLFCQIFISWIFLLGLYLNLKDQLWFVAYVLLHN